MVLKSFKTNIIGFQNLLFTIHSEVFTASKLIKIKIMIKKIFLVPQKCRQAVNKLSVNADLWALKGLDEND
jgi:hypothetical protein